MTILDIHRFRGPKLFYYTEQTVEIYCLIFELLKYYFIRVIQWTCVILEVIHRWRRLEAKISRLFHVMWLSFNQYNWFFIMWGIIISVNVLWPYWSVFEIVIWILIISKSLQSSKLIFSKLMIGMPVLYYKVRAFHGVFRMGIRKTPWKATETAEENKSASNIEEQIPICNYQ